MADKIFKQDGAGFAAAFLAGVVIFLLLIFALAIIVDPHNDFGTGIFRPLVMTNRTVKIDALARMAPKPQIIIMGSSRVYTMDPDLIKKITGKSAYNASVSFCRPEDLWAMENYIVNDLKIKPEMIIAGINLGEFNNDDVEPQTINNKNLAKYLEIGPAVKLKSFYRGVKDSINQDYIKDIFVSIFKLNIKPTRSGLQSVEFSPNGRIMMFQDSARDEEKINHIKTSYYNAEVLFKNTQALNPSRKLYLENFLAFANQRDIKIKLVLMPMPAETLERLRAKTPYNQLYAEFMKYTDELHLAYQFDFYDFSSVEKFHGLPHDFNDATHPGVQNVGLITKLILADKTKKIKL